MTLTKTVKFLQKVVIIHDGQALIVKRAEDAAHRPGKWDLPGGNAEWPMDSQSVGDLHRAEAAREVREELGLELDPSVFTDENLVHFTTYFEADLPRYAFICGWRVQLAELDPALIQLSDEHTDLAWVSPAELDQYDFGEPVGTFVKTIIQNAFKKE